MSYILKSAFFAVDNVNHIFSFAVKTALDFVLFFLVFHDVICSVLSIKGHIAHGFSQGELPLFIIGGFMLAQTNDCFRFVALL